MSSQQQLQQDAVGIKRGGRSSQWDRRKNSKRHRPDRWGACEGKDQRDSSHSDGPPDPRYMGKKKRKVAAFVAYRYLAVF